MLFRSPPSPAVRGQELIDLFFSEMDRSLREMGVGDLSIPKRMKKLAAAWNGRFQVYDAALDDADAEELAAAIARNVLADVEDLCDRVAIMYGGRVRAEGTCDELLEQGHATLLETPELPERVIAEVREVLRRHALDVTKIERPRRKLESLFMEIVERARAEGVQTSGASNGGRVADFLGGGDDQPADASASAEAPGDATQVDKGLLDRLVASSKPGGDGSAHPPGRTP